MGRGWLLGLGTERLGSKDRGRRSSCSRYWCMRTQVMAERAVGLPWLEQVPADGGPPQRTPIPSFPFTLGRNESADLPIASSRVSREHAVILRDGVGFRVRDLGSTNGTYVNGRRIDEAPLEDGDVLVVADVEFTFFAGANQTEADRVTQPIFRDASARAEPSAPELVYEIRRLQEEVVGGGIEPRLWPVVSLFDGQPVGHEVLCDADLPASSLGVARGCVLRSESRWSAWLRRLARRQAAQKLAQQPANLSSAAGLSGRLVPWLFVKLDASEIGALGLSESLFGLAEIVGQPQRLVVELPDSAVADSPYFRRLCEGLRREGVLIAHDGFCAGVAQLAQRASLAPQFLKLAPALVRGVDRNRQRQRQIRLLVEAAGTLDCQVIAAGLAGPQEASACREAGCLLGQYAFTPASLEAFAG